MDNWRMARICESIGNAVIRTIPVARGKRRPKPYKVADFLPVLERRAAVELTPSQREHIRKKHGKRRNGNR